MVLVGGGLGMAGWFLIGLLGERLGRRRIGMWSFVGVGAAAWAYYDTRWLAPAFALLVFVEAGATVALNALGTELFPTHLRGTAKSWITNAAVVGAIAGMGCVGALGDTAGGADTVIRLLALLPIVSAVALVVSRDERPRARGHRTGFGVSPQVHFASAATRGPGALPTASSAASIEPTVVHNPACSG